VLSLGHLGIAHVSSRGVVDSIAEPGFDLGAAEQFPGWFRILRKLAA